MFQDHYIGAELALFTRYVRNQVNFEGRVRRSQVYLESQAGIWLLNDEMGLYGCAFCRSAWDDGSEGAMIACADPAGHDWHHPEDGPPLDYRVPQQDGAPPSWRHKLDCAIGPA